MVNCFAQHTTIFFRFERQSLLVRSKNNITRFINVEGNNNQFAVIQLHTLHRGGGVHPIRGGSARKGCLFHASGIYQRLLRASSWYELFAPQLAIWHSLQIVLFFNKRLLLQQRPVKYYYLFLLKRCCYCRRNILKLLC